MRIILITLWLLVPLGLAAYHYGPGQEHLKLDHTEDLLAEAREAVEQERWDEAILFYQDALFQTAQGKKGGIRSHSG